MSYDSKVVRDRNSVSVTVSAESIGQLQLGIGPKPKWWFRSFTTLYHKNQILIKWLPSLSHSRPPEHRYFTL